MRPLALAHAARPAIDGASRHRWPLNPSAVVSGILLGAVWVTDLAVPDGLHAWAFYGVPICIAGRWGTNRGLTAVTVIAALLTVFGGLAGGPPHPADLWNRVAGVALLGAIGASVGISNRIDAARRRADERRDLSERQFREFLAHLPAVAWVKAADFRYAYINPTYERRFGLTQDGVTGRTDFELFPPDVAAELRRNDAAVRDSGTAVQTVETVPTPDGTPHHWLVTKFPLPDLSGGPAVGGIALDVTAERLAEDRFRLVFEASPAGMLLVGPDGTIVLANANADRLFGIPPGGLRGRSIHDFVPKRVRADHPGYVASYFQNPVPRTLGGRPEPVAGCRSDGTEFFAEVGLSPIRTADGLFALAVVSDVTRRRLAADVQARYAAELARSNADLQQFAYVASHDLQEPLRMVTSYLDLLRDRYAGVLDDRARRWIGFATDGAARMKRLVEDLLEYSRVGTRGKPLVPTDCNEVVRDTLRNLEPTVREAGAVITVGPLPTVAGDRVQLTQLFQNLIANALKFRGPDRPEVAVTADRAGRDWVFKVRDNGIGIDPRFKDRIFVLFQRLHTRDEYSGTGIGLAVCKKIVERHGGGIWVESEPGRGATFCWTLPADQAGEP